jgi:phospholipid/cholesterol/gamma-HCH transport system substrate-binding protein
MVAGMQTDVNYGNLVINALLKDSGMVIKLNEYLDNVQKGNDGFTQNMEALKHNFLFVVISSSLICLLRRNVFNWILFLFA